MNFLDMFRPSHADPAEQLDLFPGVADVLPGQDMFQSPNPDVPAMPDTSHIILDLLQQIERNTRPLINDEPSYNVMMYTIPTAAGETVISNTEKVRYATLLNVPSGVSAYLGNGQAFPLGSASQKSIQVQSPFLFQSIYLSWAGAAVGTNITAIFSSEPFTITSGY